LRDAIELEWEGIPSVCIVHAELRDSARAIARISGHPDYPVITVGYPHIPIAVWTEDEVREIAREVAPQVRELLLRPAVDVPVT
jgi:hypothetical protein